MTVLYTVSIVSHACQDAKASGFQERSYSRKVSKALIVLHLLHQAEATSQNLETMNRPPPVMLPLWRSFRRRVQLFACA